MIVHFDPCTFHCSGAPASASPPARATGFDPLQLDTIYPPPEDPRVFHQREQDARRRADLDDFERQLAELVGLRPDVLRRRLAAYLGDLLAVSVEGRP